MLLHVVTFFCFFFLIILLYLEKFSSEKDWKFKKMGPLCFSHGLEEQMGAASETNPW